MAFALKVNAITCPADMFIIILLCGWKHYYTVSVLQLYVVPPSETDTHSSVHSNFRDVSFTAAAADSWKSMTSGNLEAIKCTLPKIQRLMWRCKWMHHCWHKLCSLPKLGLKNLIYRNTGMAQVESVAKKSDFVISKKHIRLKCKSYIYSTCETGTKFPSHFKHTPKHAHTRSVVGSVVMHLIHRILITVPVCGKQSQRSRRGYSTTKTLTTVLALVLLFLWPQVNKPTSPPGLQAKAKWRRHWYAIRWINSNHCCGAGGAGVRILDISARRGRTLLGLREWGQLTCL